MCVCVCIQLLKTKENESPPRKGPGLQSRACAGAVLQQGGVEPLLLHPFCPKQTVSNLRARQTRLGPVFSGSGCQRDVRLFPWDGLGPGGCLEAARWWQASGRCGPTAPHWPPRSPPASPQAPRSAQRWGRPGWSPLSQRSAPASPCRVTLFGLSLRRRRGWVWSIRGSPGDRALNSGLLVDGLGFEAEALCGPGRARGSRKSAARAVPARGLPARGEGAARGCRGRSGARGGCESRAGAHFPAQDILEGRAASPRREAETGQGCGRTEDPGGTP